MENMEKIEKAGTIADAVGTETLIIMAVLFVGVLYWGFKPRWQKRQDDKQDDKADDNNPDLHI